SQLPLPTASQVGQLTQLRLRQGVGLSEGDEVRRTFLSPMGQVAVVTSHRKILAKPQEPRRRWQVPRHDGDLLNDQLPAGTIYQYVPLGRSSLCSHAPPQASFLSDAVADAQESGSSATTCSDACSANRRRTGTDYQSVLRRGAGGLFFAEFAEVGELVDAGGVAVGEVDAVSVVADGGHAADGERPCFFGRDDLQRRGRFGGGCRRVVALLPAGGAGTTIAQQ